MIWLTGLLGVFLSGSWGWDKLFDTLTRAWCVTGGMMVGGWSAARVRDKSPPGPPSLPPPTSSLLCPAGHPPPYPFDGPVLPFRFWSVDLAPRGHGGSRDSLPRVSVSRWALRAAPEGRARLVRVVATLEMGYRNRCGAPCHWFACRSAPILSLIHCQFELHSHTLYYRCRPWSAYLSARGGLGVTWHT